MKGNRQILSIIGSRLRSNLATKLALLVLLNLWVYVPYILLQRHPIFPALTLPPTSLDRLLPFWPESTWIYLSIYLLMPIGPFLVDSRDRILRYAAGIAIIGLVADAVFLAYPTQIARPASHNAGVLYSLVIAVDRPSHAFPSLHAAFALYSALTLASVVREMGRSALWTAVPWLWASAIVFATLTTKQHIAPDALAGAGLGYIVALWAFRAKGAAKPLMVPIESELPTP